MGHCLAYFVQDFRISIENSYWAASKKYKFRLPMRSMSARILVCPRDICFCSCYFVLVFTCNLPSYHCCIQLKSNRSLFGKHYILYDAALLSLSSLWYVLNELYSQVALTVALYMHIKESRKDSWWRSIIYTYRYSFCSKINQKMHTFLFLILIIVDYYNTLVTNNH